MRRPNFFIAGAPKCGTSALEFYLKDHPAIYAYAKYEPHYFSPDVAGAYTRYTSEEDYLNQCFTKATDEHKAVGEKSALYLYSVEAARNIKAFDPSAKIIVMLRNPVEVAYSLHSQLLFSSDEDVHDFAEAWNLQDARRQGESIPKACTHPKTLLYRDVCLMGAQLERLYEVFPQEQVLAIVFDDFKADTREVYERTLSFLGVPSDGREFFPRTNPNKAIRSRWMASLLGRPPKPFVRLYYFVGRTIGWNIPLKLLRTVRRWNSRNAKRDPLGPEMRAILIDAFRDDVHKLGRLLNRDLSHWLSP